MTNYQALPDDETFLESSGIRMGVQEMTRFGMEEKDFDLLSGMIAEVIIENKDVKEEVKRFRENFLEMKFCLSLKEAIPVAAKILKSVFAHPGLVDLLMESLEKDR